MIKHNFQKKFYYARSSSTPVFTGTNSLSNKLKLGITIDFFGALYEDEEHTKEVAKTLITYKIVKILSSGVIIETTNKYSFNENNKYGSGDLIFKGKIFSPNFNIISKNNKLQVSSYTIEPNMLLVKKGTKNYKDSFGYSKYIIDGNGKGTLILNIDILSK